MYGDTYARCNVVYSSFLTMSYHHGSDCTSIWNPRPSKSPWWLLSHTKMSSTWSTPPTDWAGEWKRNELNIASKPGSKTPARSKMVGLFNTWKDAIVICYGASGRKVTSTFLDPWPPSLDRGASDPPCSPRKLSPADGKRSPYKGQICFAIITYPLPTSVRKAVLIRLKHTYCCFCYIAGSQWVEISYERNPHQN